MTVKGISDRARATPVACDDQGVPVPVVSVLMAVHNGEKFLEEALDSIVHQTFTDWELVLVDDGSDDRTPRILSQYESGHPTTVIRRPRRSGAASALNAGLQQCRGEYIARMDADDICEPRRLEVQVDFMRRRPGLGLCSTAHVEFGAGAGRFSPPRDAAIGLLGGWGPSHPTVLFRREALLATGVRYNPRFRFAEDFDLFTRLAPLLPMGAIDEPLLRYRRHEAQTSTARWAAQEREALQIQGTYIARCLWDGSVPRVRSLSAIRQWLRRARRYARYEWRTRSGEPD